MPISAQKRPAESALVAIPQQTKRTRNDEIQTYKDKQLLEQGITRVSNLFAPIMKLEGHESEIFTCEFHPDGEYLGKKPRIFLPNPTNVNLFHVNLQRRPALIVRFSYGLCTVRNARICLS